MLEVSEILNASILIVDDQEANVVLLERLLRNVGYQRITTTMDPCAVYDLHLKHQYDLILLDLQMPVMDGFEVMERLKQIDQDDYLPVLVITAQPGHKLRALGAGAKDFVSKPFDLVEVQTRIHNMLEVRLLYRKLDNYNKILEQTVLERTAELRESEARFKSFTELSSDWYWEQDHEGNFTKISGPVFEMLGIEANDMLGESPIGLAGWNVDERALLDANLAARRPFLDFVYSRINPDGAMQYLQVSGEPMFDLSSRFIGYRGIGMDVTERMRPNQEQRRFRMAIDFIDHGVCLVDVGTMRIVDVSQVVSDISGYSRNELLSMCISDLHIVGGPDIALQAASLPNGEARAGALHAARLQRKDGTLAELQINWTNLPEADKGIAVGVMTAVKPA